MISRRRFVGMAGAAGCAWPALGLSENLLKKKTNLLVLMTDQHHAHWLGCAGHPLVKTPNLDRLAKEGIRFTQAYCPVPYCSPTRLAIETGLSPASLGLGRNLKGDPYGNIKHNDDPKRLKEPQQVYQHSLAEQGYACHQLGKWHLGAPLELSCFKNDDESAVRAEMKRRQKAAGAAAFDAEPREGETEKVGEVWMREKIAESYNEWCSVSKKYKSVGVIGRSIRKPEFHYESVLADHCIGLLQQHRDEPFAITYSVSPPHALWTAPAPYYDMYDPEQMPIPETWDEPPPQWASWSAAQMGRVYGEAGLREYMRCYAAQITMMDDLIGRILDELDRLGLAENTLVVFTSDHGNMTGQHGMIGKSSGMFSEDNMQVPMLMRLPGTIPAGIETAEMISSLDLPPTFLDVLNAPPLPKAHGRSVRGIINGKEKGYDAVYAERGVVDKPSGTSRMVRTKDWKLCLIPYHKEHELYDLRNDPLERKNVYSDPANADIIRQLKKQLTEHMEEIRDPVPFAAVDAGR